MKNILVVDSGVGAISIAKEISKLVKTNLFVYVDNIHSPLGEKNKEELQTIAYKIVKESLTKIKIDLVVIACNTLTVATINYLRANFNVPFVGTEPNVKIKEKKAIAICTTYTANNCNVIKTAQIDKIAMPKLATLIDQNLPHLQVLSGYLYPFLRFLKEQNYNAVSLGCTHYTYISNIIKKALPNIKIYQNKFGVAKRVQVILSSSTKCAKKHNNYKRLRKNKNMSKSKFKLILSKKNKKFKKQLKHFIKI